MPALVAAYIGVKNIGSKPITEDILHMMPPIPPFALFINFIAFSVELIMPPKLINKHLVICDLKENDTVLRSLKNSYANSHITFIPLDITNKATIDKAYEMAAKQVNHQFDVVINGCGLLNERHIDATIDINLRGVIHSSLKALTYMDKSKGGKGGIIVNISSVLGLEPTPMFAIYSAAKSGILAFTRAMAHRVYNTPTGVNFITMCPGFTATPLLDSLCGKETLIDFIEPMAEMLTKPIRQTADVCAKLIVQAIEMNKNGSVWIIDNGTLKEMEFSVLWRPKLQE